MILYDESALMAHQFLHFLEELSICEEYYRGKYCCCSTTIVKKKIKEKAYQKYYLVNKHDTAEKYTDTTRALLMTEHFIPISSSNASTPQCI